MTSYLVQGLCSNSTSLLTEGFNSTNIPALLKLFFYLNNLNINSSYTTLSLITNTKQSKLNIIPKYSKLTILHNNKLVQYRISKYSYLNKINVN